MGVNMKYLFLITILFFTGCSHKPTICPKYPKPTQHILERLKSLNDHSVDLWLIKQYKLNKKLKVCNE